MTLWAAVLIFISLFMHVTWNTLSKSTRPSLAFYLLMNTVGAGIWLTFFLLGWGTIRSQSGSFWLLFSISAGFELLYSYGLANGYKKGDISLVYPLIRALPVVLTGIITLLFGLGKPFGAVPLVGMVIISVGCVLMSFRSFHDVSRCRFSLGVVGFIVFGAAGVTGYTLCDSQALNLMKSAGGQNTITTLGYLFMVEFSLALGELVMVLCNREERLALREIWRDQLKYPLLAGVCCSGAYGLVLLAMPQVTNVSFVQAFRQLSLPLGFLAGVVFLREKATVLRTVGLVAVIAGLSMAILGR